MNGRLQLLSFKFNKCLCGRLKKKWWQPSKRRLHHCFDCFSFIHLSWENFSIHSFILYLSCHVSFILCILFESVHLLKLKFVMDHQRLIIVIFSSLFLSNHYFHQAIAEDTIFAKGGTCLYKIGKQWHDCMEKQNERLTYERDNLEPVYTRAALTESVNRISCCAYYEFLDCIEYAANKYCSNEKHDMAAYSRQLGPAVPSEICYEQFPRQDIECSGRVQRYSSETSSSISYVSSSLLSLLLISIIILLYNGWWCWIIQIFLPFNLVMTVWCDQVHSNWFNLLSFIVAGYSNCIKSSLVNLTCEKICIFSTKPIIIYGIIFHSICTPHCTKYIHSFN